MSLTLFFIVLSLAIGYLLYDTFKKSRQKNNTPSQTVNNRLKINYTRECTVLNTLSKQKLDSLKTKTISIHLIGDPVEPTQQQIIKARQIIMKASQTRSIYLLQKQNHTHNKLFIALKDVLQPHFIIPYNSNEGAVAILRQLSCGLHLESEKQLYLKIRQYLSKIWYVGEDPDLQALREFKTEVDMINLLSNLQTVQQQENK